MKRQMDSPTALFPFEKSAKPTILNKRILLTTFFLISFAFFFERSIEADNKVEDTPLSEIAPTQTLETHTGKITLKTLASIQKLLTLEPFILSTELESPSNFSTSPNDIAGSYGDFYLTPLEEKKIENVDKSLKTVRSWLVYPNYRGNVSLPPIPFRLESSDDKQTPVFIQTSPLFFEIPTIEAVGSVDDIKADFSPVKPFPVIWFVIVTICLTLVIAYLMLKRRNTIEEIATTQIPEDPYKKAVRRLCELKESRLYLENSDDFYSEIASVLRIYLAERFTLNAEESTTPEILKAIDSYPLSVDSLKSPFNVERDVSEDITPEQYKNVAFNTLKEQEIRSLLESSLLAIDLVKFARQPTAFDDASRIFEQIQKLINIGELLLNERIQQLKKYLTSEAQHELPAEIASAQSNG